MRASTRLCGIALQDLTRGLRAADVGHPHVHEHHVGAQLGGKANAHPAAGGLADHLDSVLR